VTVGSPPPAKAQQATPPVELSLAPLGRRVGALLYESLLIGALVIAAGFLLAPVVSPGTASAQSPAPPSSMGRLLSFAGLFGVALGYCVWFWSDGRRTLPMKTWGLGLRRTDGTVVRRRLAAKRFLVCLIGPALAIAAYLLLKGGAYAAHGAWLIGFNFLWALVDPNRQFLHDRLTGTRIVNDRENR
jgi:uncharacterized RDD family membrane protein YckC